MKPRDRRAARRTAGSSRRWPRATATPLSEHPAMVVDPSPGTGPLVGKYVLRTLIGQGATGVVHEAYDPVLDRVVALKGLRAEVADPDLVALLRGRFLGEARAAGRLAHPGVVAVHDFGEHEGRPYIVMERVRGRTLSARLAGGRRETPAQAASWALPLLDALAAVHRRGLVHRDVKPDNVFLGDDGSVKLGDFGVAAWAAGMGEAGEEGGGVAPAVGTPHYAAPEQLRGEATTPAADLWSVGVMLYQALTGCRPFAGNLVTVVQQVLQDDPPLASSRCAALGSGIDALLARALRKAPTERPTDAEAFRAALRAAVAEDAGEAPSGVAPGSSMGAPGAGRHRRREAARRLRDAQDLASRALAALDRAQAVIGDGAVLVEGPSAAQEAQGWQRRLETSAETLVACARADAQEVAEAALDAGDRGALRDGAERLRELAARHEAMGRRLGEDARTGLAAVTTRLDRLDEQLAALEAYRRRDAMQDDEPTAAEPARRRREALDALRDRCVAELRALDGGPRLPSALRVRVLAAGRRLLGRDP